MAPQTQQQASSLALFRVLRIVSPVLMVGGAGLCYMFAGDDMKLILAGAFLLLAVAEFVVFHILINKIESGN